MAVSTKEIVKIHVKASGPVSLGSIVWYVKKQTAMFGMELEDEITEALNDLMRDGTVAIYD
ncbi:MAG: hypothetical protein WC822_01415 [Candidatus Paceibacterota bacterium]|jgi:hypothetical protein